MNNQTTIVCVDDEPGMIELVGLVLKSQDMIVIGAKDGATGLEAIRQHKPDIVLLDIMMPGIDGWEVYRRMRADETMKEVPVIILTARNSSFEEVIARERAGVNDYITKPFVPDDLRNSIAKVLVQ